MKRISKKIFGYFFEDKLLKYTEEENFYEHDIDKNYLKQLLDDMQNVNQRVTLFYLFINNLLLQLLITFYSNENFPYLFNYGIITLNLLSFVLIISHKLFKNKITFLKSNCFTWISILNFDILLIFCIIAKIYFLKFENEHNLLMICKFLSLNFFLNSTIIVFFYQKVFYRKLEIISLIIYKIIILSTSIIMDKMQIDSQSNKNKIHSECFDFTELINYIFYGILAFYLLNRKKFFVQEIKRIIDFKSQKCEYYQSLLNILNKSFLSFNISNFRINSNSSFINFIKKLGLSDLEINYALDIRDIKGR